MKTAAATTSAMPPPPSAVATRAARVAERVRAIPTGSVRTYADIDPAAPRAVGRILARMHDVPWH